MSLVKLDGMEKINSQSNHDARVSAPDVILNNPFRVLGLYSDANEREITKRVTDLKMYLEIGKTPSFLEDFDILPACERTVETVEEAKRQIEQTEKKALFSLLWFSKHDSTDSLALDALKEGKTERAKELWEKVLARLEESSSGFQLSPDCRIDNAIVNKLLLPYLDENYRINCSNIDFTRSLRDKLMPYAEAIRSCFRRTDDNSFYIFSEEPIGLDEDGDGMELDFEINRTEYEEVLGTVFNPPFHNKKSLFYAKNLIVMRMCLLNDHSIASSDLKVIIALTGRILLSNKMLDLYVESVTYSDFRIDYSKTGAFLVDHIISCFGDRLLEAEIAESFLAFPPILKEYAIDKIIARPVRIIENQVSDVEKQRQSEPRKANIYGENLYKNTREILQTLKSILGIDSLKYGRVADMVSEEILSCSFAFFNKNRDEDTAIDPGDDALKLAHYANEVATDVRIRDKIANGLPVLEDWIKRKPVRDRRRKAGPHIDAIINRLNTLPSPASVTPSDLGSTTIFLSNCTSDLNILKNIFKIDAQKLPSQLVIEDFENNDNKWPESAQTESEPLKKLINGRYIYANTNTDSAQWMHGLYQLDFSKYGSFTIECSVTKLEGPDESDFGLKWAGISKDNVYSCFYFFINGNGYFATGRYIGEFGNFRQKPCNHIIQNDATNKLTIRKSASEIQYYVNDSLVETERIANIDGWGIGFFVNPGISIAVNYIYFSDSYVMDFEEIKDHNLYMNISSAVAGRSLDLCIAYANLTGDMQKPTHLMWEINKLDMVDDVRERLKKNSSILWGNLYQSRQNKPGCFIATMIYGDYCAPEVRVLRRFRDQVLDKHWLGRKAINLYYKYSPFFVRKIQHIEIAKKIIKLLIDGVVKCIERHSS